MARSSFQPARCRERRAGWSGAERAGDAPDGELGGMVADGAAYLFRAWWVSSFPGLFIFLTVMAYNLAVDGLRDAFDPRRVVPS